MQAAPPSAALHVEAPKQDSFPPRSRPGLKLPFGSRGGGGVLSRLYGAAAGLAWEWVLFMATLSIMPFVFALSLAGRAAPPSAARRDLWPTAATCQGACTAPAAERPQGATLSRALEMRKCV